MNKVTSINKTLSGEMEGAIKVVLMTPDHARTLLERDSRNRPTRVRNVLEFAADMKNDGWGFTNASIGIAKNGDVLDGTHRLLACIESGSSFLTIIVYDLDPAVFKYIDSGSIRTLADFLYIEGVPNHQTIAGGLGWVWLYDNQGLTYSERPTSSRGSKRELLDSFKRDDPEQWQRAARAAVSSKRVLTKTIGCACHFLFQRISATKADDFFQKLATGEELMHGDVILRLRDRLLRDRAARENMPQGIRIALILKAWVAYLDGKSVYALKLSPKSGEKFPTIGASLAAD